MELNSKQRKVLEKAAHNLQPLVIVGGSGVTENLLKMADTTLADHELVKVKFNDYKDEKQELSEQIRDFCNACLVRIIGNVAVFYRPAEKPEDRRFEKALKV